MALAVPQVCKIIFRESRQNLQDRGGGEQIVFVDCDTLLTDEIVNGMHPLQYFMTLLKANNIVCEPVVTVKSSIEYLDAAIKILAESNSGLCLRLQYSEKESAKSLLNHAKNVLDKLPVSKSDICCIVDLGAVNSESVSRISQRATELLKMLPFQDEWRSVVLASGAFPFHLSAYAPEIIHKIPRADWQIWLDLLSQNSKSPNGVAFGDYAIANPSMVDFNPRTMTFSANLRYTISDSWMVAKGRNVRDYGYHQFSDLCQIVSKMDYYSGNDFSEGDRQIVQCARHEIGHGNASKWREIGTSHHLTFVALQVANLFDS